MRKRRKKKDKLQFFTARGKLHSFSFIALLQLLLRKSFIDDDGGI